MNFSKLLLIHSRMSARERLVLYCAVAVILAAAADRLVIGPILGRARALDQRIRAEEEAARHNRRIIAEQDRVKATLATLDSYSKQAQTQEQEIANILGEVEQLARKTSLYLADIKPTGVQEDSITRRYSVDLNCEAQMEQIVSFIYEIETSGTLFLVDSFVISPKSKDSSVAKVNMKISSVIFL